MHPLAASLATALAALLFLLLSTVATASQTTASQTAAAMRNPVSQAEGCVITQGMDVAPGLPSVQVRCHWADVSVDAVDLLLARPDHYDDLFWMVAEDRVELVDGDRVLVHQRQEALGLRPREVLVWVSRTALPHGGYRYSWVKSDIPFVLPAGHVEVARNDGAWEVRPHRTGGVELQLDLAYDPGGMVPAWAVAWVQTAGTARMLRDFRVAARGAQARIDAGVAEGPCPLHGQRGC